MSTDVPQVDLEKIANDPNTPTDILRLIATQHPELRPAVALNPGAYDALVHWLGSLNEPEVEAALEQRAARYPKADKEPDLWAKWFWVGLGAATVVLLGAGIFFSGL